MSILARLMICCVTWVVWIFYLRDRNHQPCCLVNAHEMKWKMSFVFARTYCLFSLRRDWSYGFCFCNETGAESHVKTPKICYDSVFACLDLRSDLGHGGHQRVRNSCFVNP